MPGISSSLLATPPSSGPSSPLARRPAWWAVIVLLRPRQWIKNLACLGGLLFSGGLTEPTHLARALMATAAFCFVSSAVYILNDLLDRDRDRTNPRTAARPLASGELSAWSGLAILTACLMVGALLTAHLGTACLATAGVYAGLNVAYSVGLKREAIADVMCIALGFVLRLLLGILAIKAVPTAWGMLCMFFLATFLGFAKRRGELGLASDPAAAQAARPVLNDYSIVYLDVLMATSAAVTLMCYAVFTVIGPQGNPTLVITTVPVAYCVLRYLLEVIIRGRGHSPEDLVLADHRLWIGVLIWAGLCVLVIYGNLRVFDEPPR